MPRESRPIDLAIRWDYKQSAAQTVIEVQEAKLQLHMEGPRELLYGHKETYKLRVSNAGSGEAENVVARLWPQGANEAASATHNFGLLAPGEEKWIDVEINARQAGNITMKIEAQCDGGLRAESTEPVLVRRAVLKAELEGPRFQFVDTVAVYRLRLKNSGDAAAAREPYRRVAAGRQIRRRHEAPELAAGGSQVQWKVDELGPAAERIYELRCMLTAAGASRLDVALFRRRRAGPVQLAEHSRSRRWPTWAWKWRIRRAPSRWAGKPPTTCGSSTAARRPPKRSMSPCSSPKASSRPRSKGPRTTSAWARSRSTRSRRWPREKTCT